MEILVFGSSKPDCKNCRRAETLVEQLIAGKGINYRKLTLQSEEARRFKILVTPSIVVNDQIVALGEVPPADSLRDYIASQLAKET